MTITVRLLSTYQGNSYNDIVRLPDAIANALIAGNNATLNLAGGNNVAPPVLAKVDKGPARLLYSASGTFLGLGDSQGNLLLNSSGATTPVGATVPGAPTSLALTAAAGAIIAAFTAPASTGGDPIQWYELTLSNGTVVRGDASPIAAAAPAGAAVTATVRAVNGVGTSAASNTSNSVTPTGVAPSVPATAITLTGPTSATVGTASGAYTVALSPTGGTVASPVTVTPTAVSGVTFTPATLTLTTASPSGTFTANAATAGTKSIAVTNNGGLTNPAAISLVVASSGTDVAPSFTSSPTISAATIGSPATYSTGAASGTPTPTLTTELMVWGRPLPVSTVLSEVQRSTIDIVTGNIAIRQTATNSAGIANRMSIPALRAVPDTTQDPRWTQHPYFKGLPQVGKPVTLGGLTPAGTGTMTSNHKFCVSDTPIVEGVVDAAAFAAATATTGTTSGLNTQGSATATYPVAEVGKYAYAIVSMNNGTNTIYFRTKSWQVIPAGVATNTYRFAAAGGGKVADRIYTNNTGVQMNVFGYVDVVIGSVQHGALKVLLANLAMPDTSINTPIGSGSDYTFLSANLCVPNAAAASCPSVLFGGVQGTIANGTYDVASDAMNPSAFGGKTAQNPGDRLIFKYEIAIAPGGKLPYVSGGDSTSGSQSYLYNPANTTINNKNNGIASNYTGTAPTATLGDGIPFDIIGLQLSGDAPVDFVIGDSIAFNPQGRSYWAAAHYLCDGYGSPVIANSNGGRVGATHALFNSHPYLQSKIKYANRVFIEAGTNSQGASNVGNADALIALDNTTLGLITSNVAPTVTGLTATTVVRMKLLMAFADQNSDSSNYSSTTAETQSPVPAYRAGGDLEQYFYPYLESQVPAKYARVLDVRPALRLSDNPASPDYYKAQPNTFGYEGAGALTVHPSIQGGIQAGLYLRDLLAS